MMQQNETPRPKTAFWSPVLLGAFTIVALLGGIVGWAATTRIDGAVVASGMIAVESERKRVQHLEGGIVSDLLVREGDFVRAGDPLLRLDATRTRSELSAIDTQLFAARVREARLQAELRGETMFVFGGVHANGKNLPESDSVLNNEREILKSRYAALEATVALLERRIEAFKSRIAGAQRRAENAEVARLLVQQQRDNLQSLFDRQLVEGSRLVDAERALSAVIQERDAAIFDAESLESQMRESIAQIDQVQAQARADASDELVETQADIRLLEERRIVLEDQSTRGVLVAPQSGRVLNLNVAAAGAIVGPRETVLEIVPTEDSLVVAVRIPSRDVERVFPGLKAKVRLVNFSANTTPLLIGKVDSVSADALLDDTTGATYYEAIVSLTDQTRLEKGGEELVPGMPVEVLVSTGERLAASYLLRPLNDAYARSFLDE